MAETNEQATNASGENKEQTQQTPPDNKVEFSEAQQRKVDDLINAAFAKAFTKAEAQFTTKVTALETQLAELKTNSQQTPPQSQTQTPPKETKTEKKTEAKTDDIQAQLKAQLDEIRAVAETLKAEKADAEKRAAEVAKQNKASKIKEEFIRASEKINFFDRMSEFDHMEKNLEIDEGGRVIVKNQATGLPRLNTSLEPMTLEEFVQDYAKQKPWTVKMNQQEVGGGSGGGETRKFDTKEQTKVVDYTKMTNDELLAEAEKVIAKQYERQ